MTMPPEKALEAVADCDGDMTLSLRLILTGYMTEMGGPLEYGREMGRLQKDPEMSAAARVSLATAMTKLIAAYDEDDDDDDLIDEEQLQARINALGSPA